MKHHITIAATALAVAGFGAGLLAPLPVGAQGRTTTTTCEQRGSVLTCSTTRALAEYPGAKIIRLRPAEDAAYLERDRLWVERCKPRIATDEYGVDRYVYALPGCEYGGGRVP